MTDERVDALIRQLEVDWTPDVDFVRDSLAAVKPLARSARIRDRGRVGRLLQQLEGIGAVHRRPRLGGLRLPFYLAAVLVLLLALAATFAFLGRQPTPRPQPTLGRNGLIAFTSSDPGGSSSVHLMNPDGSGERVIDAGNCPTFLSDDRLAFWAHPQPTGMAGLTILAPTGAASGRIHVQLHYGYPQKLAISPDGRRVLEFWGAKDTGGTFQPGLVITPMDGGPSKLLVPTPLPNGALPGFQAWSPDGHQIAFTAVSRLVEGDTDGAYRSAIYVVDDDGSNLTLLSSRPGTDQDRLAWSPDGRLIAFGGVADASAEVRAHDWFKATPAMDIFVIRTDGSGETNVTDSPAEVSGETWSPDGSRLAFLRNDLSTGVAHVVSVSLPDIGSLVANPSIESGPLDLWRSLGWSPDGTLLIAYTSTESVAVVHADLSAPARSLASRAATVFDDCGPSWQRLEP